MEETYLIPIAGEELQRLTTDNLLLSGGPTWTADGREIVFSSTCGGLPTLWRVQATGGHSRRLVGIGEYAHQPAICRVGFRLAYLYHRVDTNIWRIPGPLSTAPAAEPSQIVASREEYSPQFSPDGSRIAFVSHRSGSREIWVCDSDGGSAVQLTNLGGSHTGSPRWSPDGRQIAFDSRPTILSADFRFTALATTIYLRRTVKLFRLRRPACSVCFVVAAKERVSGFVLLLSRPCWACKTSSLAMH